MIHLIDGTLHAGDSTDSAHQSDDYQIFPLSISAPVRHLLIRGRIRLIYIDTYWDDARFVRGAWRCGK